MIDSHCHLADEVFAADLEAVVERARSAGLERALVILEAGNAGEAAQARTLETLWPEVRVAIGVHPHHAQQYADDPGQGGHRSFATSSPRRRRRGPSARSGSTITTTTRRRAVQRAVFRAQVKLAREIGLPVVVHTREADEDTIAILTDGRRRGGARRACTASPATRRWRSAALGLGFYISAAGIVTFPKSAELRNTLQRRAARSTVDRDRQPVSRAGAVSRANATSRRTSRAWWRRSPDCTGIPAAEMARRTTENFHALFRP